MLHGSWVLHFVTSLSTCFDVLHIFNNVTFHIASEACDETNHGGSKAKRPFLAPFCSSNVIVILCYSTNINF